MFCSFSARSQLEPETARPPNVHKIPNAGVGEGIQIQPLPYEAAANRTLTHALSQRAPDKDLVSKPTDERKEGDSDN